MSNNRKAGPRPAKARATQPAARDHGGVCVAFIHPGETSAFFTTSMLAMMLYDGHTERHITGLVNEWSSANVSAARNKLTALFCDEKPDADWLMFIDADMGFEHDALERLMRVADPDTAPVVGGLCFGAQADRLFPTIYQVVRVESGLRVNRTHEYERDAVVQVAATGSAFLLIHRRVIEAVREARVSKAFPWFQETELDGDPVGEDITFCLRAGMLGFPIFVDTRVKVGHHKSWLLTEEVFESQQREAAGAA